MTLERAAELVQKLREVDGYAAVDLFCHFDDIFKLEKRNPKYITQFAELCGYLVATDVQLS